jgi:hypothetical protein
LSCTNLAHGFAASESGDKNWAGAQFGVTPGLTPELAAAAGDR